MIRDVFTSKQRNAFFRITDSPKKYPELVDAAVQKIWEHLLPWVQEISLNGSCQERNFTKWCRIDVRTEAVPFINDFLKTDRSHSRRDRLLSNKLRSFAKDLAEGLINKWRQLPSAQLAYRAVLTVEYKDDELEQEGTLQEENISSRLDIQMQAAYCHLPDKN